MEVENIEEKLKRRIDFLGLLALCVGLNIGGALFALTSLAAVLTGPSLPLAMLLSSIPAFLAIMPYGILTSALPTTSATYRYAQLCHPTLALVCMLTLAVCMVIGGQPLLALSFGRYFKELVPADPILIGLLVLTVLYVVNLLGIRLATVVQIILFFSLLSGLVLFIVLGVPHLRMAHFSVPFPHGPGGIFAAAGLLFTFCSGGFLVVDLGGEVIRAREILPRVLFLGLVGSVALYVLIHLVTVGVQDWQALKGRSLTAVAEGFMSASALAWFIVGGALAACATTINVIFSVVSRGLMVVSAEGLLPAFLGRVNRRYGTPHWGLTAAYLISALSLVTVPSLFFLGSMLNLGLVLAITVVAMAGLVMPKRYPELLSASSIKVSPKRLKNVCRVVLVLNSLIFVFLSFALGQASIIFLGIALLSYFYAISRRGILKKILIELYDSPMAWFEKVQGRG